MATPLLTTKFYIPPFRPELVSRPHLIDRLNAGLHRKFTLISAPAGSGKTTLLSEWAGSCAWPVAWVSLDEGDNDPARFLAYFVAALRTIEGNIGKGVLGVLQSPQPPPIEHLLSVLINQANAISELFALVFDDYHVIKAQPIHSALTFLLDHLPPQMHLMIATRIDPPLPIARLRGRGQLTELRAADLRFTPDEVTRFLNQVMGLELSADDVTTLASRTEGWITGLQMAAVSAQGREDIAGFIRAFTGSNRYILDYLVEEVLQRQPDSVQAFLLQTAILDRLTGRLCDAVLGREAEVQGSPGDLLASAPLLPSSSASGQEILEYLERANLFIVPLDDRREWYRYHHLFVDLLRKRMHQTQPDQGPTLHRRASEWHECNGLMALAIDHALAAGDSERAAHLIDEHAETVWGEGAQTTLLRWLEALPDEQVASRPRLCIFHAMVLCMAGQHRAAQLRLQAAERALGSITDGVEVEEQGMVATVRAFIAYFQGDVPAIIQFSRQALEVLPEENTMWRSSAAMSLGDAYRWNGDVAAANRAYAEAVTAGQAAGNVFLVLVAGIKQILIHMLLGRLRRASEMCRQQLQLMGESGWSQTPMAGGVFAAWGDILREWNDLDAALHYAQEGCELSEQGSSVGGLGLSYLTLLRVSLARRDVAGAEEMVQKLEKLGRESNVPVWIASGIAAWKSQSLIEQGCGDASRLAAAAQFLQERGLGAGDDIAYPREIEYLSLARLLIAQGKGQPDGPHLEEAIGLLDRLLQAAQAGGRVAWVIGILVLRAVAFQAQGDVAQAMVSLERALSLAEPEGYVRVFVDEGPAMAELLRYAASRGVAPGYVSKLLAAFDVSEYGGTGEILPCPRTQSLIDPLTERELEVLRLLVTHLSSSEIAQELFIAASTVRSHVKSIYGKLDVHKRRDAVQRAKELGLL